MNEHQYLLAWTVYIAAALGCLLACYRASGWMWRYLREPLRVAVCVLLFTPTVTDAAQGLFTPSIAIVALDWFGMGDSSAAALSNLKLCALAAFLLYLLFVLLRGFWKSLRGSPANPGAEEEAYSEAAEIPALDRDEAQLLRALRRHDPLPLRQSAEPTTRIRRVEPYI